MSKVLYIEDHPAQRDILAQMLELNGFEVATASDGQEGVDKTRSWLPDLILMDIHKILNKSIILNYALENSKNIKVH